MNQNWDMQTVKATWNVGTRSQSHTSDNKTLSAFPHCIYFTQSLNLFDLSRLIFFWPLLSLPSGHDPLLAFPAAPRWRGDRTFPVFRFKSEYKGYDSAHTSSSSEDPHLLTWHMVFNVTTCCESYVLSACCRKGNATALSTNNVRLHVATTVHWCLLLVLYICVLM